MKNTRRDFLKAAAALAATSSQLTKLPKAFAATTDTLKSCRKIALDATGLKIKTIESFTQGHVSIVRITTDDGSTGSGQISTYDADISATVLHRKIAPLALGADPANIDDLVDICIEKNYKFPWSYVCRALAGLDTAIWDLLAKRQNISVCELLGGKPRPIPAYGSSMSRDIKPDDEAERLLRLKDTHGYRAFKIRIGKVCGHDQDQWPGRTEEIVPTVRKAVGDNIALLVDANSCYTPKKAIEVGKILEENNVCHFEEPCPYWELEWTAKVTAALNVLVAGGEQDNDLAQWRRMVKMHAVDIVQPDICYVGGLTRALRVAKMAADANLTCVPHSANLAMVTIFTIHMLAVISNPGPFLEFAIEPWPWQKDIYHPELKVENGLVNFPQGPGWGVTIRKDWLKKAKRQISQ
ncbi:MAG: mandelate racemase/muconate lactonizing enzyme family protein [Planctomycetota bacterium]|nr:MAG: mandelate racemase/muconate lactonizing enzyme family protein [Planctomycetota bacterium]